MLLNYQPTPVEMLCLTNNLPALQMELDKFNTPLEYLKKVAPNALYYAAWRGSIEMVEHLLKIGLSARVPDTISGMPTHYHVMDYAAMRADGSAYDCLALLKRYGADFKAKDAKYGRTALHSACLFGNAAAVEWLAQEAIATLKPEVAQAFLSQPECGRFQRNTPLHNAAFKGHWVIVERLLTLGADTKAHNHTGIRH